MNIYLADCVDCDWSAEKTTAPDARQAGWEHKDETGHHVRDPLAGTHTETEGIDE